MDIICEEIGINLQHVCETAVPGRFELICDKEWLKNLELFKKIATFPTLTKLDRRAHPSGPLEHPWTRILVQTYQKQPQRKVFSLPKQPLENIQNHVSGATMPLTYSQSVTYVSNTNFKNLWEAAYKKYPAAHIKFCKQNGTGINKSLTSPEYNLLPYDVVLKEVIQHIFGCPVINAKLDRMQHDSEQDCKSSDGKDQTTDCHANVLPAIVAIETTAYISVFFYPPAIVTSLYDCISYSPAVLAKSYNKPLFLIYQIFQLLKSLHSFGYLLGDLRMQDILIRENLWVQAIPHIESNLLHDSYEESVRTSPSEICGADDDNIIYIGDKDTKTIDSADYSIKDNDESVMDYSTSAKFDLKFAYDLDQFSLREYCEMWCNGQLSNFDYLTILNNASGRSLKNPAYYHIMPWVTDFSARNGANWRDLSKSKYRLNKGDTHLDLMFSHACQQSGTRSTINNCSNLESNANGIVSVAVGMDADNLPPQTVPHHVSDFLSEITYFVYKARRTHQHILREHVRPIWVPAEYPVSIQRLQEWTPDECIPEFFADPMIFKSIHEDLPDLELPTWASCPEDFICKHREALESQYVSERLQHWIDLNFGYKLGGKAAIKSKNVCLSVVDQHKNLCQQGIVQLFTQPHPPKRFPSPWFNKTPPRLSQLSLSTATTLTSLQKHQKGQRNLSSNSSKRLAKSTENLHSAASQLNTSPTNYYNTPLRNASSRTRPSEVANDELVPTANFYHSTNFIELPKNYNPCALLHSLENMQYFFARTFPKQQVTANAHEKIINGDLMFDENSEQHSFTNHLFADDLATPGEPNAFLLGASTTKTVGGKKCKGKSLLAPCPHSMKMRTLKQMVAAKRELELKVVGCLIVELFATQRLRPLLMHGINTSFADRLRACRAVAELYKHDIPKCLQNIVRRFLQIECIPLVAENGLPPLTPTQLLEPIFSNLLIPFPNSYYPTYALVRALHDFDFSSTLLELHTHFNCQGKECAKYADTDRKRVLFERKIGECKVSACCAHLGRLLEPVAYEQFSSIELLLPHVINLLTDERTSILAAWNLFDPVAQALGQAHTQKHLLQPIMKLYDVECFERGMMSFRTPRTIDDDSDRLANGHIRFSASSSFKSRKSVKLYHHSFLLRLIVRFGLRCFLQNFIAPLIEAVGGYKEPTEGTGFHYHCSTNAQRRTSKNLNYIEADDDNSMTLMSNEVEQQDTISENITATNLKQEVEEVFSFDDDTNSDRISNSGTSENKSVDSFDIRPSMAEEAKEEYNASNETTPKKLAISEIIYGSNISNSSLDEADKVSLKSNQGANDSPTNNSGNSSHLPPTSPTIAIPTTLFSRTYHLSAIDCDIGSRKSIDSFEIYTQAIADEERKQMEMKSQLSASTPKSKTLHANSENKQSDDIREPLDSLQASVITKMSEAKALQNNRISEMSAESLVWLSHRLGPVLTSRFITRNLLKMLTLCYVGQENLLPESNERDEPSNLNYFSVVDARVMGDRSAVRVLECLMSIAALFGEEVILLQYFPHITELIALGTKRVTSSLEGAMISSLQLLKYIVPCIMDTTLMEHLKDVILDNIIMPVVNLLSLSYQVMPSGYLGRSVLARKLLDAIYVLCVRIGPEMSREHLCIPALREFFLIFDKAYCLEGSESDTNTDSQQKRSLEEIRDVFGPALAHTSYLAFLHFFGESNMKKICNNLELILTLCHEFEQPDYRKSSLSASNPHKTTDNVDCPLGGSNLLDVEQPGMANSFGSQVVGNRIEVTNSKEADHQKKEEIGPGVVLDMVAYKFEQLPTTRHLKGNWLAYWRHEISRPEKNIALNLQQIKLQSFVGHTNSVRSLISLDNENSFMSASKDKTVKLWSLRSEGDGTKMTSCQFTYTAHKKAVHSLAFLDAMRFVVSCDSGVHIWDPFIGRPIGILDSQKHNPITVVKTLPSPSPLIVAGTAESSVKIIDSRCMQYINEWQVNVATQSNYSTVRCISVAPSGNWLSVGLSSGSIIMLDTRTGMILNSWRPMECDVLQLAVPNEHQLISSSLDHGLAVWNANDGILHYQLKQPAEPAHFLQTIDSQMVFATTGNRIGIYTDIRSSHAAYSITKLRSETFRGVLTSLAVLPLNHAFLAGNESGNIVMLC